MKIWKALFLSQNLRGVCIAQMYVRPISAAGPNAALRLGCAGNGVKQSGMIQESGPWAEAEAEASWLSCLLAGHQVGVIDSRSLQGCTDVAAMWHSACAYWGIPGCCDGARACVLCTCCVKTELTLKHSLAVVVSHSSPRWSAACAQRDVSAAGSSASVHVSPCSACCTSN